MKTLKKKLEVIADEADKIRTREETQLQKLDWKEYGLKNPYEIVKEFIQEKGLKLYGGQALHEHLVKHKKGFYENWEFPDYDVFSPDAWNHAKELANRLYKMGYLFAEARSSILNDEHHQTYKVGVDMIPMLDLTQVGCSIEKREQKKCDKCGIKSKHENICISIFNNIPAVSIKDPSSKTKTPKIFKETFNYSNNKSLYPNKLFVCSPEWLKSSMYRELSEPMSNPARWPKVGTRLKLFNKFYQTQFHSCSQKEYNNIVDNKTKKILDFIGDYFKNKNFIHYGATAHNFFIKNTKSHGKLNVSDYKVYVINNTGAYKLLDILKKKFKSNNFKIYQRQLYWKEHDDVETILTMKTKNNKYKNLATFIESDLCLPYVKYNGIKYATIDRLKYLYYYAKELPDLFKLTEENPLDYNCLLKELINAEKQYNKTKKRKKSKFRRFVVKCQGQEIGKRVINLQNRWFDKLNTIKKTKMYIDKPKKGYLTKVYPLPKEELYLPYKPEENYLKKYYK